MRILLASLKIGLFFSKTTRKKHSGCAKRLYPRENISMRPSLLLGRSTKQFKKSETMVFVLAFILLFLPATAAFSENVLPPGAAQTGPTTDDSNNITLDFKEADINTVLRV